MNTQRGRLPSLPLIAAFAAVIGLPAVARADGNWISDITDASITTRSSIPAFITRAAERAKTGYYCIDVEKDGGTLYGIFVKSPAITDGIVMETRQPFYMPPSMRDEGWREVDFELTGYGMPGETFYLAAYIKSDGITGDAYYSRSAPADFIAEEHEFEDDKTYIVDFEHIDGQWWALLCRSDGLFSGHGTFSSRDSFSELRARTLELEDKSGSRILDIECVDGSWYALTVVSDAIGDTGLYSRSSFADFVKVHQELKAEGRYLIDMEIEGGSFYGLVVKSTAD